MLRVCRACPPPGPKTQDLAILKHILGLVCVNSRVGHAEDWSALLRPVGEKSPSHSPTIEREPQERKVAYSEVTGVCLGLIQIRRGTHRQRRRVHLSV